MELIETVIIYKLPRLSREEIQAMLQVHDIRESRVYQEGVQEGEQKGIAFAIASMAANGMSPEAIAAILKLDIKAVRQAMVARGPEQNPGAGGRS